MSSFIASLARPIARIAKMGLAAVLVAGVCVSAVVLGALPASAAAPTWPTGQYGGVQPNIPFTIPIAVSAGFPLTSMTVATPPASNFSSFGLANINLTTGTADMVGTYTGTVNASLYTAVITATNTDGSANGTYTLEGYTCSWTTKNYREVTDGVTTLNSKVVTSATADFTSADVGQSIISQAATSNPIPAGDTIATVTSTTKITLATAAISSKVGLTLLIGSATDNAVTTAHGAEYQTGSQSAYGAAITNGVHTGEFVAPTGCQDLYVPTVGAGLIIPANPFAGTITPSNSDNSSAEADLPLGVGIVETGGSHTFNYGTSGMFWPATWSNGGTLTLSVGTQSDVGDTDAALTNCPPSQTAVNAGLVSCIVSADTGSTTANFTFSADNVLINGQNLPQTTTFTLDSSSVPAGGSVNVTGGTNWWGSSTGTNVAGVPPVPSPGVFIGTSRATAVPATTSSVEVSPTTYACGQASSSVPPNPCTFTAGVPSGSFTVPASLPPGTYNVYIDESNTTALMGNGPNDSYTNVLNSSCVIGAAGSSGCNGTDEAVGSLSVTSGEVAPTITSVNNASVTEGVGTLNFPITTTGSPAPTVSITSGTLPSGVSLSGSSLVGTPAWGTAGTYVVTLDATNGVSPDATQTFTLTVTPGASISLTKSATTAAYGAAGDPIGYSYLVTNTGASAVSGVAVSDDHVASVSCPSGPVNPGDSVTCTGTYDATQADVDAGSVTNTASATATTLGSTTVTSNSSQVTVPASNATSALTLAKSTTSTGYTAAGNTIPYNYLVTNSGTRTVHGVAVSDDKIASVTCPGGSVAPGSSVTCNATYTVTAADVTAGSVTNNATATATDSQNNPVTSNSSSVTVNGPNAVSSLSLAKSATSSSFVGITSIGYDYLVTNTGNTTLTGVAVNDDLVASVSCPSGTLAAGASETCTGSYTTTSADDAAGSVTNNATATATDPQSHTVTSNSSSVTVPEGVAFTSAASTSAVEGEMASFAVTTESGPPPATISTTSSLPTGMSLVDNGDGTATLGGTPVCGTVGTYPLDLSASNGVGTASQTLELTVNPQTAAKPSFLTGTSATATAGTPFSFTVATNCEPLPAITMAARDGVSLVDNGDGTATLSGTPTLGGVFALHIVAKDTKGTTVQVFTLTVLSAPSFVSGKTAVDTTGTPFSFTIRTRGYPAPAITGTSTPPLPSGVTLVDNGNGTATLSGTVPIGDSGAYSIALSATNGIGSPASQTLTLRAEEAPVITSGDSVTVTRGVAMTPFAITATGYPAPGITATGLPRGLTVKTINGARYIGGTPMMVDVPGTYTATVTAKNVKGAAIQTFTVTLVS